MEEVMAFFERLQKAVQALDLSIAGRLQGANPLVEFWAIMDRERIVRPERRQDPRRHSGLGE